MQNKFEVNEHSSPSLAAKVAFLSAPDSYSEPVREVICRETHMSWVFLADEKVYKLKKPVRFPYLDFSTLERRERSCRAEVTLNRRLAPDVYLGVVPLIKRGTELAIGGRGTVVDWLVVMRRLKEEWALEYVIEQGIAELIQIERVATKLGRFYRSARRPFLCPEVQLAEWRRNVSADCGVLLKRQFELQSGVVRKIAQAQERFLDVRAEVFAARVRNRYIVDGHGDLRPEHIWLCDGVKIIDCLEFNARLRMVDPMDEIAYLSLECERLGAPWIGDVIRRGVSHMLHDHPPLELFLFYRCHRAALRARLALAHLLEPDPRTPEKWRPRAQDYLEIAKRDAMQLNQLLRTRGGR